MFVLQVTAGPAPPLFVYGTLLDGEVLSAVLDRPVDELSAAEALVKGWRAMPLPDRPYPGLVRLPDAEAPGRVLFGLGAADLARLTAYEGAEFRIGYLTAVLANPVDGPRNVAVAAYLPVGPAANPRDVATHLDAPAWSLADWRRDHKPALLAALRGAPAAP